MNPVEHVQRTKHGIPIRNIWHMLVYAWDAQRTLRSAQASAETSPSLDALLASELSGLMERRLRNGLGRAYSKETQVVRGIRGRVDFVWSARRQLLERGQTQCRYNSFIQDVPRNQFVKATLRRMLLDGDFGPDAYANADLRNRLRRLIHDLHGVADVEPHLDRLHREPLGRNDLDYRIMLSICSLYLRSLMPTEQKDRDFVPGVDREELIIHDVFERFVASFYKLKLSDWIVSRQQILSWHASSHSSYLPIMRTDLQLTNRATGHIIVVDTKFTADSLKTNYKETFNSNHLYQIYAYLRTQEGQGQYQAQASGLLLYPTVSRAIDEAFTAQGHVIRIATVDLAKPWADIEESLLSLVA